MISNIFKPTVLAFVFVLHLHRVFGQESWKEVTRKDGITISAKHVPESKIKGLRVECTFNASLSQIVALLLDVEAATQWVSHTKSAYLVKKVSPSELYYYSEVSLPWPLDNRDFVARISISQNSHTKVVTVEAPAIPGWIDKKTGVVRIDHSVGSWSLTPINGKTTRVQYVLQVDPGGVIPAWLVNSLSAQGPMDSFRKMRIQLELSEYRNARFAFIRN
jgi:hypothetical protein